MQLRVAGFVKESITDGKGIRYTVFTQGCPHICPGCHNPQTHNPQAGRLVAVDEVFEDFQRNPLLRGITFSGGEPFLQPEPLCRLASLVHSSGKDVTVYTGWTYGELCQMNSPAVDALLAQTDVLIDGRYVEELRNLELHFRGSENQRIIDMNATREKGLIVSIEQ